MSYTNDGMLATLKDGEANLTTFEYDGFDRLAKTRFPLPAKGSNASSTTDYEQLTYDANSNVTQRRLRDGGAINFTYDNLDRVTVKGPPNPEASSSFSYDNLGRTLAANKGGIDLGFTYDALGRQLTQTSPQGTVVSVWDAAGRRTQLTYPGSGLYLNYDYLVTGEVTKARENGASSGIGVLSSYSYDDLGNRTAVAYGNGGAQAYGYDPVSRLTSLTVDLSGTASDLTKTFAYNPANQIVTETRSNDAYAQVLANNTQTTVTNGLNQLAIVNGTSAAYDARGNMTTDPVTGKTYTYYGANNQLWTNPSPYTVFAYDALDRLQSFNTGAPVTNYVSDGSAIVAEYDGSNVLQKRYAFGAGGQPLVAYDAAGNRTWMLSDERGSVVALANDSAAMTAINTYDEYGIPSATNAGTFQYAGMLWLPRPGLYAPTFRVYGAHLGRFGQTDPIGYAGGVNLYNYTGNDPVNLVDPLGLATLENGPDLGISLNCLDLCGFQQGTSGQDILVTGPRCHGTWLDHMCFDSFDPIDFSPFFEPFRRGETGRAEAGAGDADRNRQCPSHPILGALGKANGAINTLIGGAAAAGSALAGALSGNSPQANFGNNSIQVTNAWTFGGRAYTIGNVQVYSAGNGPGVGSTSYTGAFVNNGSHEEGHTIQSQILGPLYLPSVLLGSALGNNNPMEVGADKYALGQSCTGF